MSPKAGLGSRSGVPNAKVRFGFPSEDSLLLLLAPPRSPSGRKQNHRCQRRWRHRLRAKGKRRQCLLPLSNRPRQFPPARNRNAGERINRRLRRSLRRLSRQFPWRWPEKQKSPIRLCLHPSSCRRFPLRKHFRLFQSLRPLSSRRNRQCPPLPQWRRLPHFLRHRHKKLQPLLLPSLHRLFPPLPLRRRFHLFPRLHLPRSCLLPSFILLSKSRSFFNWPPL